MRREIHGQKRDEKPKIVSIGLCAMTNTPEISPAAKRMRRHRKRRRDGLHCLTVELRDSEIDMLVCKALLKPEMRNDKTAITRALHEYFDETLSMPR
jgi:hypothetical protein